MMGDHRTSRRAFLGMIAGAGATLAGGCSAGGPWLNEGPASSAAQQTATTSPDALLGPEPTSLVAPASPVMRPAGADPLVLETDVCVVGGGAAGAAAATTAARLGAETVLLEESSVLGGNVTRGLVNPAKIANGGGPMVAGYFQEIVRLLEEKGQAIYPGPQTKYSVPADLDALRHLLLVVCRQAGADVRLGTSALWVENEEGEPGHIRALWGVEQGRLVKVLAGVFVDCTGDGHLGYQAHNAYWLGDRARRQTQGQTLVFCAAPVDFDRLIAFARSQPGNQAEEYQVVGLKTMVERLREGQQEPAGQRRGAVISRNMEKGTVSISISQVFGNHLEPGGLSRMVRWLQDQNRRFHAVMRADLPGFEKSHVLRMAERPHLREGRRLVGHYQLSAQDVLGAEKPKDSIARGWSPIDLRVAYEGAQVQGGVVPAGDWYGIPFRCLVAHNVDNLMMAGRCISVTHEALGSTGVSPLSMALGQAAGTGAALAAATTCRPADLAATKVRDELARQGALI